LPPVSNFLELNFRTYVRSGDKPGVLFLSIHANKRLAVHVARWFSPLPYVFARMTLSPCDDGLQFHCVSRQAGANFAAHYTPASKVYMARRDPLSEWLLERYRLYAGTRSGGLIRNEVHHDPWEVQDVVLKISANTLGQAIGLDLSPTPDRAHFSSGVDALAWSFQPELTNPKIEIREDFLATDGTRMKHR